MMDVERRVALRLRLMVLHQDVEAGALSAGGVRTELERIDRLYNTGMLGRYEVTTQKGVVSLQPKSREPVLWE